MSEGEVGRRHPHIPQDGFPELDDLTCTAPAQRVAPDETVTRVDAFIRDLERPQYVYRMARSQLSEHGPLGRSAQTRLRKAAVEIDALIRGYGGGYD